MKDVANAVCRMSNMTVAPEAVLNPAQLRAAVVATICNTFGEATGALKDWPDQVDLDTVAAVPAVADHVIVLVLANIGAAGHLADYLKYKVEMEAK